MSKKRGKTAIFAEKEDNVWVNRIDGGWQRQGAFFWRESLPNR